VVAATTDAERTVAVLAVWLAAPPHVRSQEGDHAVLVGRRACERLGRAASMSG